MEYARIPKCGRDTPFPCSPCQATLMRSSRNADRTVYLHGLLADVGQPG
jgi:hypothetical protein